MTIISQLCTSVPYVLHGLCEDYLTCDIAFNAVMPLSRASTRGRYSRIEGVTVTLQHPDTIKVRLRNQNKRRTPNATKGPRSTPTGLHYWSTGNETTQRKRSSSSSSLSLVVSPARYHRHLQTGFGSICEPRGLSNLAPLRSRLFKLKGKVVVWGGAAASD